MKVSPDLCFVSNCLHLEVAATLFWTYQRTPDDDSVCLHMSTPQLEGQACALCYEDFEPDDPLRVVCEICGVAVHLDEYNIHYEDVDHAGWRCESCKESATITTRKCVLCLKVSSKYPMLRCKEYEHVPKGAWAHCICVAHHPNCWFGDEEPCNLAHVQVMYKDYTENPTCWAITPDRLALKCELCGKDGYDKSGTKMRSACVQCAVDNCTKAFHVTCAHDSVDYHMEMDFKSLKFDFLCAVHTRAARRKTFGRRKKRKREEKTVSPLHCSAGSSSARSVSMPEQGRAKAESLTRLFGENNVGENIFHKDDMAQLVKHLPFLAPRDIALKTRILKALVKSPLACIAQLVIEGDNRYSAVNVFCAWLVEIKCTAQVEQKLFFKSFLNFVGLMNIGLGQIICFKIGHVDANGKVLYLHHLVKDFVDGGTEDSVLYYTANDLVSRWTKELQCFASSKIVKRLLRERKKERSGGSSEALQ